MKRIFDIFLSGLVLVCLSPVMAIVALAVWAHDRGPVFYKQVRVGRDGVEFSMYKFRSMRIDADKIGGYSTEHNDQRITRVGRFIRRTSLDELPQLCNVLKGDMSVVGPRPDVPKQRVLYSSEEWTQRHTVRPGVTGLAQATLRSSGTEEQRKALDLEYVRRSSLPYDIWILVLTVRQILFVGGN